VRAGVDLCAVAPPARRAELHGAQVACGGQHSLVVTRGGHVLGFGKNWSGQLGLAEVRALPPTGISAHAAALSADQPLHLFIDQGRRWLCACGLTAYRLRAPPTAPPRPPRGGRCDARPRRSCCPPSACRSGSPPPPRAATSTRRCSRPGATSSPLGATARCGCGCGCGGRQGDRKTVES
jgi:hypothetical protein